MTTQLTEADFETFFQEVHGVAPFPWQARLATQVLAGGKWPSALDLPTAAGKTAALDIALFALAAWATGATAAPQPRRIIYVVDRRLVVDGAYARASTLRRALGAAPPGSVTARVRDALQELAGPDEEPLAIVRLRGGLPQEPDWARTPIQPLICLSTIDQAGSRLLFRGYGVGRGMAPVHAGLFGGDVLWLLDEAHLSGPFQETLGAVAANRARPEPPGLPPFQVVALTATRVADAASDPSAANRFPLDGADRATPALERRLSASKPARLVAEKTAVTASIDDQAEPFAVAAERLAGDGARRIGVIVNRVALARAIHDRLSAKQEDGRTVLLLTGRSRPLDRETVEAEAVRLTGSGVAEPDRPVFLVATQTVEVGADLDVAALVTEAAPLDSLRQRFGRLNRLGRRAEPAPAVILRLRPGRKEDPPYGAPTGATWDLLQEWAGTEGVVDFGIDALQARLDGLAPARLAACLPARIHAPVLLPAHIRAWADTNPPPQADPDPALWLHGPQDAAADVTLVWRADLTAELVRRAAAEDDVLGRLQAGLAALPPAAPESLAVPLWAARRWLEGQAADALTDVEGAGAVGDEGSSRPRSRRALLWRGAEEPLQVASLDELRPGDVLVLPAETGGCDRYGWHPGSDAPVTDLADRAALRRGRAAFRLDGRVIADLWAQEGRESGVDGADGAPIGAPPGAPAGAAAADGARGDRDPEAALRARRDAADALARTLLADATRPRDLLAAMLARAPDPARPYGTLPKLWWEVLQTLEPDAIERGSERPWNPQRWRFGDGTAPEPADADADGLVTAPGLPGPVLATVKLDPDRQRALAQITQMAATATLPDPLGEAETEDRLGQGPSLLPDDEVSLETHCRGVAAQAAAYAEELDLPTDRVAALRLAGLLHDAGKAEPRYQAWLRGGDPWAADPGRLLAKSLAGVRAGLSGRAGWPAGARHEAWSVRFAQSDPEVAALDPELRDLVLWLIGTHHGRGLPAFPALADEGVAGSDPLRVTLDGVELSAPPRHGLEAADAGWVGLCRRVEARHGAWELARLSAILRLADHRRSEAERARSALDPGPQRPLIRDAIATTAAPDRVEPAVSYLRLEGLEPGNPQAFLALLGLMRALELAQGDWTYRVRWSDPPRRPELEVPRGVSADAIAALAAEGLARARPSFDFPGRKDIDWTGPAYRAYVAGLVAAASGPDDVALDLAASLACDGVVKEDGRVESSQLCLIYGQGHQHFLVSLGEAVGQALPPERLAAALFAPWTLSDQGRTFRWDPSEDRRYALRFRDPSGDKTPTEAGALQLAALGFTLLPSVPVDEGRGVRLVTLGFRRESDGPALRWPLWSEPCDLAEVRALMARSDLEKLSPDARRALGVVDVLRSRRISVGKFANLTPAVPAEAASG